MREDRALRDRSPTALGAPPMRSNAPARQADSPETGITH
jgi:hypothetical protein